MKLFRTLKEARAYIKRQEFLCVRDLDWYRLKTGKVYKYAVGTRYDWRYWQSVLKFATARFALFLPADM